MTSEDRVRRDPNFHIVGVGASAGGLEALEHFFGAVPEDSGLAYVVIQHLSPHHQSHMDELLARHTKLTILVIEAGMALQRNTIYLIPPRTEISIVDWSFRVAPVLPATRLSLPVDHFFTSLADEAGAHAIGIVLSGTGSDGSRGIVDIEKRGGLVLVQSMESARFDGMPMTAQASGSVHAMMLPEAMPASIMRYIENGDDPDSFVKSLEVPREEDALQLILERLRVAHGIDFSAYRSGTITRRLEQRRVLTDCDSLGAYDQFMSNNPEEVTKAYRHLLIGVTQFFRDRVAWETLSEKVLTDLVDNCDQREGLRFWVAACSAGQEAYSLAMAVSEVMRERDVRIPVKIFATDAHPESLETASRGVYPPTALTGLRDDYLTRYFEEVDDGFRAKLALRQMLVFARHDIVQDAPFRHVDLVTCRNVLIYFKPATQFKTISSFQFALRSQGVLFLGASESPGANEPAFDAIDDRWRIYRKRDHAAAPLEARIGISRGDAESAASKGPELTGSRSQYGSSRVPRLTNALLARFMPAGIVVDERYQLRHVAENSQGYLRIASGKPSLDLFAVVHECLKAPLRDMLKRARQEGRPIARRTVLKRSQEEPEPLRLIVEPVELSALDGSHFIILFEKEEAPLENAEIGDTTLDGSLRDDLFDVQQNLNEANQELDSASADLQASNEKLLAANEELHSVNEELYSVNAEYKRSIQELTQLTKDMDNLLTATFVGVIFLDDELCIRKFTPMVAETLGLKPHDVGRKIHPFASLLSDLRLVEWIETVKDSQQSEEHQVTVETGRRFLVRVCPNHGEVADGGVVLVFVDIEVLARTQASLELRTRALECIDSALVITDAGDPTLPITYANDSFVKLTGYQQEEVIGQNCRFLQGPETSDMSKSMIRHSLSKKQPCSVTLLNYKKDGSAFWNELHITPVLDSGGEVTHFVGFQSDISERVRAAQTIEVTENFLSAMLGEQGRGAIAIDNDGRCVVINAKARSLLGYSPNEELSGRDFHMLLHHRSGSEICQGEKCLLRPAKGPEVPLIRSRGEVNLKSQNTLRITFSACARKQGEQKGWLFVFDERRALGSKVQAAEE